MYKKTKLKNGLRLILAPMDNANTVTVLVMIGTGSRFESKELNGMSHFLEHMFFKGTKKRPNALSISTELDGVGANFNAFTGKEITGFYIKTDSKHTDLSVDVMSDILLNSKFNSNEINKERGVILEEMKMVQDTPMHYVADLFEKLIYGNNSLGRLIIGKRENILRFKRADFLKYLNNHYTTKNAVVCIAGGKKEVNRVKSRISKAFNNMNTGDADRTEFENYSQIKQSSPRISVNYKKTDQAHFCLGVRAYGLNDDSRFALKLLSVILGGNMSSRLFTEVRENRGLAYYIRTTYDAYVDNGYLTTQTGVDKNKIKESIAIILKEYKKIAQRGVSEKDLKKAKEYIKGISSVGMETSDQIANFLTNQEILLNEILTPDEIFRKIDKVTTKDIKNIASDIFVNDKLNLAVIGEYKNKKIFEGVLSM